MPIKELVTSQRMGFMDKIDALTNTLLGKTTEKVAVIHAAFEDDPTTVAFIEMNAALPLRKKLRSHLSRPTRFLRHGGAMRVSHISAPLPHVAAQVLVIWYLSAKISMYVMCSVGRPLKEKL